MSLESFIKDFQEIEGLVSETPEHLEEIKQLYQKYVPKGIVIPLDLFGSLLDMAHRIIKLGVEQR